MSIPLSPAALRQKLKQYGLRPQKRLGQNFLIDENIRRRIIAAAGIRPKDKILEIGPGAGALTEVLLEQCGGLLAVELDRGLAALLRDSFGSNPRFSLLEGDARRISLSGACRKLWGNDSVKVVANIPYYLTSPLIFSLLQEEDYAFESLLLMVQKEAALRITADPGNKDYGLLTVVSAFYTVPRLLFKVPATVFYPRPEIESAVIKMQVKTQQPNVPDTELFWKIVKAAFSQRRKTLLNNLQSSLQLGKEPLHELIIQAGMNPAYRGEQYNVDQFANLTRAVYNYQGKRTMDLI